jgi:CRP/FNR family transcriptional regulator, cyclic AMP receptor protein
MIEDPIAVARRQIAALGPTGWGPRALADADIDALLRAAPPVELAAGAVLAREGETADRAFFLVAGRLRATVALGGDAPERDRTVNEITAGEVTGETGLFMTGGRRTATLTALEPSTVLALDRQLFQPGASNPALVALGAHILAGLARRIERTDAQIVEAWRAVAAGAGPPSRVGLLALLGGSS